MAEPEAYRAEHVAQSPAPRLWPGQTAVAWIRLRNVGRATWRRDGQPPAGPSSWPSPRPEGTRHPAPGTRRRDASALLAAK